MHRLYGFGKDGSEHAQLKLEEINCFSVTMMFCNMLIISKQKNIVYAIFFSHTV